MAQKIITRESLLALLEREEIRVDVIGRALVVLLKRQTEAEQKQNVTAVHNMRGFMPCDARQGCIGAKTYLGRKTLLDFQVAHWMEPTAKGYPRIAKYVRQLNEAANERKAA
jgi:hypothetical protein